MAATLPAARTPATDHEVAARLADEAGAQLLRVRRLAGAPEERGRQGDKVAHDFLVEALTALKPEDAILSEEGADDGSRLGAARVWIIDPLDGTREFTEPGRSDWAVHVALWAHGSIIAAAVALPARGLVLSTLDPPRTPSGTSGASPRLVVSRTRPPVMARHVATAIGAEIVAMGSAGAKTAAVILGEADAYLHAGGQYEWDSAAPVGVALAAGLHASRISGAQLLYNQPEPSLPDLLICRKELAASLLAAVRSFTHPREPASPASPTVPAQSARPTPPAAATDRFPTTR